MNKATQSRKRPIAVNDVVRVIATDRPGVVENIDQDAQRALIYIKGTDTGVWYSFSKIKRIGRIY